jgi:hypothetical protein
MRKIFWILMGIIFTLTGCSPEPVETVVTPADVEPLEKILTVVNAAAVDTNLLEQVRAFAEKELRVPVRVIDMPALAEQGDFQTLENSAMATKHENDVAYIIAAELDEEEHLRVNADSGIAMINAKALYTDDAEKFTGRIRRMVMRAAAFSFGLEPTPDPFCVTRDYRSLEDLDRMGNNYSPPWQVRFAEEAAKRGLQNATPTPAKPPFAP